MPYEVLLKEAYSLIDEIPREKIEYVIQILYGIKNLYTEEAEKGKATEALENMFALAKAMPRSQTHEKWSREDAYDRSI